MRRVGGAAGAVSVFGKTLQTKEIISADLTSKCISWMYLTGKTMSTLYTRSTSHNSVSQKHVLYSEVLAVTSAMRKNSRWASSTYFVNLRDSAFASDLGLRISGPGHNSKSSKIASREGDLMAGFQELKRTIKDVEGMCLPSKFRPALNFWNSNRRCESPIT
jgi:hypothetical protein